MKPVILIHGKPGLGKSTLALSVAEELQKRGIRAAHFSIGDQLRAISSGEIESRYAGELRPVRDILYRHAHVMNPMLVHGVVSEFLESIAEDVAVIDGHPRYMEITGEYEQTLNAQGWHTALVVIIDGSDELAGERMALRHRNEHGIQEDPEGRLADYERSMGPVLAWLSAHYPTLHVDANNPLRQKTVEVVERIGGKNGG